MMILAAVRIAQGYMTAEQFLAFIGSESPSGDLLGGGGIAVAFGLAFLGGLALNLTPCVLPLVPVNLLVVGRSAMRGLAYGLGQTCAYGALGVAAALGGLAFGSLQANPWFNLAVALVFAALGLSLFGVWFLDFSRFRPLGLRRADGAWAFAFGMGALSAVLAGACVAPVLVSVLVLTARLFAEGNRLALLLPFALGAGMALPWPFLGAGLQVLPKPGGWMKTVNRIFAVLMFGFAAWYGAQAFRGFFPVRAPADALGCDLSALRERLAAAPRPVLLDFWATWCKNCAAMDAVLEDARVRRALESFTVLKVQAEDIDELRRFERLGEIKGLPAFVIFE